MLKINMLAYVYIAVGLVAGEWQPQEYAQNQQRYPSPPPLPPQPVYEQSPVLSPAVPGQPPRIPQARPCRRQNIGDPVLVLTDSGWIIPPNQPSPPIVYRDQLLRNQPVQPLKPQSLTENKAPAVTDKTPEAGETVQISEHPNRIVEYVEKSTRPKQISGKRYAIDNENRRDMSGEQFIPDAEPRTVKHPHHHSPSTDPNSHEGSDECDQNRESGQDLGYDHSNTQDVAIRSAPKEVHEQAAKLLSKCAHETRRSMQDSDNDSKGFQTSSSSTEIDNTDTDVSKPEHDSKINLKSAQALNTIQAKPYLQNPAQNAGKWEKDSHVSLLQNGRVCYACSTYFDSSCWTTNATTTVKYCHKNNNACLTKMYRIEGKVIMIRDCGNTCNEDVQYNIGQKMTSCSMCHHDMCNGAATHALSALLATLIMSVLKYTS